MYVLDFGHALLWVAAAVTVAVALFSLAGVAFRDRRPVLAARSGLYALFILLIAASACLVHAIIAGNYNNEYIFNYTERELATGFKFAGLWAGLEGSLVFWTLLLAGMSAAAAFQHRWSARHPAGRRMEPYTYLALAGILGFFIFLCIHQNPFDQMSLEDRVLYAKHFGIPLDAQGNLTDGKGLNPQLMNNWFPIHPPTLYLGLVSFSVPFAFGIAALITGELGTYWVRIARRWAMVSWLFLTCGIILGGLWAYRQLGWGGYWAWDPVENASFLPWCTATAFLHSIMIQERRDMLKWWNAFLMVFTFYLTIEATYMTRSGEVASVHTFALNEDLGDVFRWFKFAIAGVGLFLLSYRYRDLRGTHRLESVMSREGAFFINNLVLVAMALVVWFLSWLPTNSHSYLGKMEEVGPPFYNQMMTPLFILLLFLTAVGPGLGWVKTSLASLKKNFLGAVLVSLGFVACVYLFLLARGEITSWTEVLVPKAIADAMWGKESQDVFFAAGIYPTGLILFCAAFIVATVGGELVRAIRGRMRARKDTFVDAFLSVVTRDNRRYGGYIVHTGIALIAVGIIASSMFREHKTAAVKIGESVRIGPYEITPVEPNRDVDEYWAARTALESGEARLQEVEPGLPYLLDEVLFRVTRLPDRAVAEAQGPPAEPQGDEASPSEGKELVTELRPERRYYPKQKQWISEPSIDRRLAGDIYVYYAERIPVCPVCGGQGDRLSPTLCSRCGAPLDDTVQVEVFLNPLMILIWAGWFVMIGGGLYALLPVARGRVGLSE